MAGVPFPFPFPSFSLSSPPPLLAAARKPAVYGMVSCSNLYIQRHERKLKMIILVNFKIRVLFYVAMLFFMKIQ